MSTLNDAFSGLKSNLELSDTLQDVVTTRHTAIRSYVQNQIPNTTTQLIGSLQRKTRIHPRLDDKFDIDILVVLGAFENWSHTGQGINPDQAMHQTYEVIEESSRYEKLKPTIDHPTITLKYADQIVVELVPAYLDNIGYDQRGFQTAPKGRGFWVPKKGNWIFADYNHDASTITSKNMEMNALLIPTIKMLKALKRIHFPQMNSFHLEVLATVWLPLVYSANLESGIQTTYSNLMRDFFSWTIDLLDHPVCLSDSKTPKICLDPLHSQSVRRSLDVLSRQVNTITNYPTESLQVEGWRDLFDGVMPKI